MNTVIFAYKKHLGLYQNIVNCILEFVRRPLNCNIKVNPRETVFKANKCLLIAESDLSTLHVLLCKSVNLIGSL